MRWPRVKPREKAPRQTPGAYVRLDDLIRLQFKARGFSFLPRQPIHSILSGRNQSRLRGRGMDFEEIRHYLPGDDIRTIDWKVTVRMRKPHVRSYTEERDRPAILVVDQRLGMFFGSRVCMKSVTAAEATALGAWRVLDQGDRVGAVIFNDEEIIEIRPHRSERTVMRILKEVVRMNHALRADAGTRENPAMLNRALERVTRLAKHDTLITLIGDGSGADEETVGLVTKLSEHNDVIAVVVYDPLEADLPDAGPLVVAQDTLQLEVDTSEAPLRRRFREAFEERLAWFGRISRQRQIPLMPLSTAEGVAVQVRALLGRVARRGPSR